MSYVKGCFLARAMRFLKIPLFLKVPVLALSISGYLTNWKDRGGGQFCPLPWLYGYRWVFSLFFSNRNLVLDVKDQNPKAQPSTFNIQALRFFRKIDIFGENPTKRKIRKLEIRLFIQKRSAKIKPRHLECSRFFYKDRNGYTWKVNESQNVLVR